MSLVRPEIHALLMRWSEVLVGLVVGLIGLWFGLRPGFFWQGLGLVIGTVGLGLAYIAWRRLRFNTAQAGPGLVEVDERQISYFAAYEGGAVSIDQLARISAIAPGGGAGSGSLTWVLEEDGGITLTIPHAASGAQLLLDAFAALPGVDYASAQRALETRDGQSYVIWSKPRDALH